MHPIVNELENNPDKQFWVARLNELRNEVKSEGGRKFAHVTGLALRAERLLRVEGELGFPPKDRWDDLLGELSKILSEA